MSPEPDLGPATILPHDEPTPAEAMLFWERTAEHQDQLARALQLGARGAASGAEGRLLLLAAQKQREAAAALRRMIGPHRSPETAATISEGMD